MQLVSLYPFDSTGRASANRIENQSITVTPPSNVTDYSYVVPRGAPFYTESLVVKDGKTPGARTLVENVDYWCVIDFLSASVALNKRISVGIALLDPGYSGTLYVTYQAVGGNYTLADFSVLEELIRERYVVKHVSYEQIINLPEGFAPEWHQHQVADMVGMGQVVTKMGDIKTAIEGREGSYGQLNAQVSNHLGSSAAHTPSQVGLANVKNYDVATIAEATTGAGNKYVTANILKQYVQQMQPVLTGFITTTDANHVFATKLQLNSYLTAVQSDAKYAYKSDTYSKTQVDALIQGIDVSSSLDGFYTKGQSDAKYVTITSIADYIKTTVADGRYATKVEVSNIYTKTQTDDKYPLKTASYTKSESDSRYLLSSALTGYLTQTSADSRYMSKSDMNQYLSVDSINYGRVTNLNISDIGNAMRITITDSNPAGNKFVYADLNLTEYSKKTEVYTKLQVDNLFTQRSNATSTKIYTKQHISTTVYRNYTLQCIWRFRYTPLTGLLHINIQVTTPFYYNELTVLNLTTGAAPYNVAGTRDTNLYYFGFEAGPTKLSHVNDAFYMRLGHYVTAQANGNMTVPITFSGTNGQEYVGEMGVTVILGMQSEADHYNVMQWFNTASDGWSSIA